MDFPIRCFSNDMYHWLKDKKIRYHIRSGEQENDGSYFVVKPQHARFYTDVVQKCFVVINDVQDAMLFKLRWV